MIKLTQNDWRLFRRLQRKHKVSTEFLRYNLENIEKFIWFETWPRIVIKRYAVRKNNRVFIIHYRLRRVLFDQSNRKMLKRMRQNIKQWSKNVVAWQKTHLGIKEYVEEIVYEDKAEKQTEPEDALSGEATCSTNEDVIQKLKQQLELLKTGRRPQTLIAKEIPRTATPTNQLDKDKEEEEACEQSCKRKEEKQKSDSNSVDEVRKQLKEQLINLKARRDNTAKPLDIITTNDTKESASLETQPDWQINLESTPEKQITTQENVQPIKQLDTDEKTEKSHTEPKTPQAEKHKTGLNFLDMLMCKVSGSSINTNLSQCSTNEASKVKDCLPRTSSSSSFKEGYQHYHEHSLDSTDGFLGFDDCERIPGMLMTPIVPHSTKSNKNSVFISESLNEYMRINDLETNYSIDDDKTVIKSKIFAHDMEGLMTPKTKPPPLDMPAVPENLLKFRTVAERKQYLQKFSKNYRLAIINNEASIYRELQRRMRTQKVKSASQMLTQSANSSMSFTRHGWNAASFINTEFNKYYYQMLDIDHGSYKVRLKGARGNNNEFYKKPYISHAIKPSRECFDNCADDRVWQYLKPIKTIAPTSKKLNKHPLPSVFKPCPLSHKTLQKPLDDDTAALLLSGGSMAVVRMPTVELEVFPECGKPLHEIAKRYLQYILPHHDISREWAEFSVSTLQPPKSLKEAEQAAAKSFNNSELRKSFTFVIPYLNDRNHILVRRVVDRSEKLDQSFEKCLEERELVPKTDFSFRQNLDENDEVLLTCADVVSDMINTVAISCSENSFIKTDPDGFNVEEITNKTIKSTNKQETNGAERQETPSPNNATSSGNTKKQKKQNSLLMELKRLNATIIDAAVKPENDKKPCSKDYCQMGCICVSLEDITPIRQHCGKPKCMLECTCKPSNQSRIMRLETDGRTLTTEDAFMLRRKATARLARMEKEFTSTVVLTENETLLINETNNDKKRRCTKAPKRYEDFTDTEDEQRKNSPKKTALTTIDIEKHLAVEVKEVHEPVYVKDTILEQLKHCSVSLVPLPNMDNIAPWCMIHNLYKCFCKGRALEGKPMIIEKEEVNTTIEHDKEQKLEYEYNVMVKPKYTFEKVEKKRKLGSCLDNEDAESNDNEMFKDSKDNEADKDDNDEDEDKDWIKERKRKKKEKLEKLKAKMNNEEQQQEEKQDIPKMEEEIEETMEDDYSRYSPLEEKHTERQKYKRSLHEVRQRFYQLRPESCRRHIPTPRRMFLYCNRRRRLGVLKYIKENENDKTRLLLNEHIMRSVYYHKIDIENLKKNNNPTDSVKTIPEEEEKPTSDKPENLKEKPNPCLTDRDKKKLLPADEIVDLLEDEEDSNGSNNLLKDKDENTQMTSSSTKSCSSFEKITPDTESADGANHFQICSTGSVITVKKFATITDHKISNEQQNETTRVTTPTAKPEQVTEKLETSIGGGGGGEGELKIPKIASCFSLNANANLTKPTATTTLISEQQQQHLDFTSATSVHSMAFKQTHNQQIKNSIETLAGPSTSNKSLNNSSDSLTLDLDNETIRDVYNSVIKTMNSLVSKKMQDIDCALQRESHIIPTPNPDILCIMKWCNFLDAFCEGFAYIWQVKMKDTTFFVVTIRNVMPLIEGAMGIVNITALKPDKMPLIGKMLLQKFRNKETEKLAVVMQGKSTHWVVKGFLKSDPNMACNKPTPETHPSLTKKINVLCSLLVKQRQKEQKKKEKMAAQWTSPQMSMATQAVARSSTQTTPKIAQILPTRRLAVPQPAPDKSATSQQTLNPTIMQNPVLVSQLQRPQQIIAPPIPIATDIRTQTSLDTNQLVLKQNEIADNDKLFSKVNSRKRKATATAPGHLSKMDVYSKMSSNIEFRSVTQSDIDEIFLPEMHKLDHKWLVLDLHNDFSHIFVPDFRDLVSLDRIQKVINFARQKSKIVKLQFFQNAPFDAFVTPRSGRKIYFGPLTMDMKSPTLILLQSVDGQMMLRELYQLQHNIVKKPEERTKAFWLVHVKGQTHFEMNATAEQSLANNCTVTALNNTEIEPVTIPQPENNIIQDEDEDDDEDCMIIDDTLENPESTTNTLKDDINLPLNSNITTNVQMTMNNLNINKQQTQSLLNTNTIIKPLNPLNTTVPVLINVPQMSVTNQTLPILTLPPNTIITGLNPPISSSSEVTSAPITNITTNAVVTAIQTAPPDAPYSSTIYITPSTTSSTSTASVVAVTTTNSNATINSSSIITNTGEKLLTNDLKTVSSNKTSNALRQALEAGAIKRRRISLYCSNKYDKLSENLAVDAVLRKILPDNADNIQIKPINTTEEEQQNTTKISPEVITTVGSTRISKLPTTNLKSLLNNGKSLITNDTAATVTTSTAQTKAPIVFDVNFMDDGDEPTASIVIKPNTSTTNTSVTPATATTNTSLTPTTVTTTTTKTPLPIIKTVASNPKVSNTNTSLIRGQIMSTSTSGHINCNTTGINITTTSPAYKTAKLPTLFNSPTMQSSNVIPNLSNKTKFNNSLITKQHQQTNITNKFSSPRPLAPKLSSSTTNNPSTPPTTDNSTNRTSLPFRTSVSLKVINSSTNISPQITKPITSTATVTLKQNSPTLTVKQVQDILNKPSTSAQTNIQTPTSTVMPIKIMPAIKATMTSSKIINNSNVAATTVSSNTIATESTIVTSSPLPVITSAVSTSSIDSANSTLTISKVQSFGLPQKSSYNSDKSLQSFITSQAQIVINDVNDQQTQPTTSKQQQPQQKVPNPPSHIQYGYIVSASYANQKFVAKRVAEEFYVKVPSVGILKLQGLSAVNNYLNKYISKMSKDNHNAASVWQFVAASKAVQVQNHQKSLLVRKVKNTNVTPGSNKTKVTANNTSLDEPILIDD